jgi:hypothetical protein
MGGKLSNTTSVDACGSGDKLIKVRNNMSIRWLSFFIVFFIMAISCSNSKLPNLGNGYAFETLEGKTLEIVSIENSVVVPGVIIEYSFDSVFILAKQKPWNLPNINGIEAMSYRDRSKAFEESKFYQYWIIDKSKDCIYIGYDSINNDAKYSNVYGPYTLEQFKVKRIELMVSDSLTLKPVN